MSLGAQHVYLGEAGYFRIWARPPGAASPTEVTFFRNKPTLLQSITTQDPFGDAQLVLNFPQITMFDRPGSGDLDWLVPGTDINVYWENVGEHNFSWKWEGFSVDESLELRENETSLTLECKGSLYQLDNYLAKPFHPQQPWPYERLIDRAMDPLFHPGLRTKPLIIEWPQDWSTFVPPFNQPDYLWFLKPYGVSPGDRWTGLTARATGSWDPTLTGFIQGMLSIMYDEGGSQWTIRSDRGRQPVLFLRTIPKHYDENVMVIDLGTPGIEVSLSRDFTQSANVIYGTGTDLAGTTFSGMQIDNDGDSTDYAPFAAARVVYPNAGNPSFNPNIMRRETQLQFPPGMDEIACRELAAGQLQRFADPGYTGSVVLRTDPYFGPERTSYPRMLARAGGSILIRGIRGDQNGILFHISESSVDFDSGATTLTIDSKYRDQLTVSEVRARTRDALTPLRMLQVGKLSTTVNDLMKPWSYLDGSGMLPRAASEFFLKRIPDTATFPWEEWTRRYPPKNPDSSKFYIRIPPAAINTGEAFKNWAGYGSGREGWPVYMAQSGSVRLTQIAAYDRDGNVMPVRFHVSIYTNSGIDPTDMPRVSPNRRIRQPEGGTFGPGDTTPFFEGAFEEMSPTGAPYSEPYDIPAEGHGLVVGWGTYHEPAGYSPGLFSRNPTEKTGWLIDETSWSFDTTNDPNWDPYSREANLANPQAGMVYVMIYCDDHPIDEPVYFLGRFWREEPGQ